MTLRGRCLRRAGDTLWLAVFGEAPREVPGVRGEAGRGDWVEISPDGALRVLTPARLPDGALPLTERLGDPRRQRAVGIRARVEGAVRAFLTERGFLETRTPLLVPCPGMEPHIRPFRVATSSGRPGAYLPTSPEFALKRLLAAGLPRVFQLAPAFRDEPVSSTHLPEFTLLEWYEAFADEEALLRQTEELVAEVARRARGAAAAEFQGRRIDLTPPWPRFTTRELFREHVGVDIGRANRDELLAECARRGLAPDAAADGWDDLYFRLWLNVVEPRLPADRAVFVTRYPASQAALARVIEDPADGTGWAKRFEAYAGGLELCNAFEELTDPVEQERRFREDMGLRARAYGDAFPPSPVDVGFLAALREGLPPCSGNALGLDRLVMLLADEPDIRRTFWLTPEDL